MSDTMLSFAVKCSEMQIVSKNMMNLRMWLNLMRYIMMRVVVLQHSWVDENKKCLWLNGMCH